MIGQSIKLTTSAKQNYSLFSILGATHRERKVSSNYFPGTKKKTGFSGQPHDVYCSEVKLLFELRDTKTDEIIMSCTGNARTFLKDRQIKLYKVLCREFYQNVRQNIQQTKKGKKANK